MSKRQLLRTIHTNVKLPLSEQSNCQKATYSKIYFNKDEKQNNTILFGMHLI